jgi:hypothetical protein
VVPAGLKLLFLVKPAPSPLPPPLAGLLPLLLALTEGVGGFGGRELPLPVVPGAGGYDMMNRLPSTQE